MIIKEVKEYERKKGTGTFNYRINISKQDNLNNKVAILNLDEYNKLNDTIKQLETQLQNNENKINKQQLEHQRLLEKIETLEKYNKTINQLEEIQQKTISELNKLNNEHIDQLNSKHIEEMTNINKEHHETINKLTAINQILISGLESIKQTSFIDRLTNKNKEIATKLINDNVKKIPKYELELKKKKD